MLYEGLLDKCMDKHFSKDIFTWLPWVGCNYKNSDTKFLIVGESNYGEGIENDRNFTRTVINDFQIEFLKPNRTFNNFDKLFNLESENQIKKFWSNAAFYDFIQRPMIDTYERPSKEDYHRSIETFYSIKDILKPDFILFIGIGAIDKVIKFGKSTINYQISNDKIDNCFPREIIFENGCKALAIHHTGRYFNQIAEWRNLVYKKFPELRNFISNIKKNSRLSKQHHSHSHTPQNRTSSHRSPVFLLLILYRIMYNIFDRRLV